MSEDRFDKDILKRDERVADEIDRREQRVEDLEKDIAEHEDKKTADRGSDKEDQAKVDRTEQRVTDIDQKLDEHLLKENEKDLKRAKREDEVD